VRMDQGTETMTKMHYMAVDHYSSSPRARILQNSEKVILALVFLSRQKKSRHAVKGQHVALST
jgi:hypothetical protein